LKVNLFDLSTKSLLQSELVQELTTHIIESEKADVRELNVIIVNDSYLRDLNKRFRDIDACTNVIAFPLEEISEIYVSYEQAGDINELLYFVVHGLLHIIGYEHDSQEEDARMHDKCLHYINKFLPATH